MTKILKLIASFIGKILLTIVIFLSLSFMGRIFLHLELYNYGSMCGGGCDRTGVCYAALPCGDAGFVWWLIAVYLFISISIFLLLKRAVKILANKI